MSTEQKNTEDFPLIDEESSLPPKAYYRLKTAAELLKCTIDELIHYGATRRLELISPTPQDCHVCVLDIATEERIVVSSGRPTFLIVGSSSINGVELYGTSTIRCADEGYRLWGGKLIRETALQALKSERFNQECCDGWWVYNIQDFGGNDFDPKISKDSLFVTANELYRFKSDGVNAKAFEFTKKEYSLDKIGNSRPDKLIYLNQAFSKFWQNADPKNRSMHHDNNDIAAWLEGMGYSATLAQKAASIIRPDWAAIGRKPEE